MENSPERKQRLNVWLAPERIKRAKSKAALAGKTLTEYVDEALKARETKKSGL